MKVFVALFALVAVANCALVYTGLGLPYSHLAYNSPALAYSAPALTYGAPSIAYNSPSIAYRAPAVHIQPQITTYSAKPIAHTVNYAHPGYVAITPGAKHVAPLPYPGASYHVNLAKAPGTK